MSQHSNYTQHKCVAARRTSILFSVQSAFKKHKSVTHSKQQRTCAACSRYVGTSRSRSAIQNELGHQVTLLRKLSFNFRGTILLIQIIC